jgi:hypothetical protein
MPKISRILPKRISGNSERPTHFNDPSNFNTANTSIGSFVYIFIKETIEQKLERKSSKNFLQASGFLIIVWII